MKIGFNRLPSWKAPEIFCFESELPDLWESLIPFCMERYDSGGGGLSLADLAEACD